MSLITVIGRGHSGTRAISHTLTESGVFMGHPLNESGDLLPPDDMYEACRVLAKHVRWHGNLEWDWDELDKVPVPHEFTRLINRYLRSVMESDSEHKGWKIPETTLVFPWVSKMFPDIKYIFWVRDPRDCILNSHVTDDLNDFHIPYPQADDVRLRRAISWKYQNDLVHAMPRPKHWVKVRFEDFILKQDETLARLEKFLGLKLAKIPVRTDPIGRWKKDTGIHYYDFWDSAMAEHGYER